MSIKSADKWCWPLHLGLTVPTAKVAPECGAQPLRHWHCGFTACQRTVVLFCSALEYQKTLQLFLQISAYTSSPVKPQVGVAHQPSASRDMATPAAYDNAEANPVVEGTCERRDPRHCAFHTVRGMHVRPCLCVTKKNQKTCNMWASHGRVRPASGAAQWPSRLSRSPSSSSFLFSILVAWVPESHSVHSPCVW
jgi:hypothetical protein